MARSRDEARSELTAKAAASGVEIAPGQLEAAGLMEAPDEQEREEAPPYTGSVFFRVKVINATINDPGAHNHVVRAPDKANAWEVFRREMGVTSVDESVNRREVTPATELEYILCQARRLRIDLREFRQAPDPKRKGFFLLTWPAPGGTSGKYVINDKGEVKLAE